MRSIFHLLKALISLRSRVGRKNFAPADVNSAGAFVIFETIPFSGIAIAAAQFMRVDLTALSSPALP